MGYKKTTKYNMFDLLIIYVSVTPEVSHELSWKMVPRSQMSLLCPFPTVHLSPSVWEETWKQQAEGEMPFVLGFLSILISPLENF